MTLCVAAESYRPKGAKGVIVFASDFAVQSDTASAEIGRKLVFGGSECYPILLAGTQTRALSLAREVLSQAEKYHQPPDQDSLPLDWDNLLTEAVYQAKFRLADEIVTSRFGVTYDYFLEKGKGSFPDDIFRETFDEISKATLDCWILVMAFSHKHAQIYRIDSSGMVEKCENFAAIGSGYYIAESSLFQRSQSVKHDIGTTIYHVYESMKLGSIAPGVGDKFEIGLAEWDWYEDPNPHNRGEVKISFLEPQYYKYLENRFARFGPRPVTHIKLRAGLIKERYRALMLTPKGHADPKIQKDIQRSKIAREREARKKAAREAAKMKSPG